MVNQYQEQRLYLMRISSRLTASSARHLFQVTLPIILQKLKAVGGDMEQLAINKKTYLLILGNAEMREEISEKIGFVVSVEDVTQRIVTDEDYKLDEILNQFNFEYFDRLYRERYLESTPVSFAERRIMQMGDKSRYIDHQVVYNHQKNK